MEYSGYAPEWDEVVFRGDPADGAFIAFWLRDGRVVAGMNVNVWDVNERVRALIRSGYWAPMAMGTGEAVAAAEAAVTDRLTSLEGVEGRVASGVPGEELAAFGGEVDLLVVGSRGYGPVRRLMLGSTSQHLAQSGRCPLLVLPRPAAVPSADDPGHRGAQRSHASRDREQEQHRCVPPSSCAST